jgi:type IV pilus assembly protein PilP
MKKIIALIFILCLLLPFGGCKKEPVTVKKKVPTRAQPIDVKKAQPQPDEPESIITGTFYAYDQLGRRDPFLSLIKIAKKKPPKKKGATPLESFDVEEIKILAIASDKTESYALILLPNQKTYTVKKGTVLGLQEGKVEEITEEKVVIREFVKDYRGNIKPKDTVLKLHKGEE